MKKNPPSQEHAHHFPHLSHRKTSFLTLFSSSSSSSISPDSSSWASLLLWHPLQQSTQMARPPQWNVESVIPE